MKMFVTTAVSLISLFSFAGTGDVNLDDYEYNFSCESAQRVITEINQQVKNQAQALAESDINGGELFENFSLSLNCEETEYKDGSWFGMGTDTATKASLETSMQTCDNVTTVMKQGEAFSNYVLLPEELTLYFNDHSIRLLGMYQTNQFIDLFQKNGIHLRKQIGMQHSNYFALDISFPNCY